MNLLVIGAGYVGLITAVCFANVNNKVYVYDKIREKLDKIKIAKAPFFEENLDSALLEAVQNNNLIPVFDLSEGFKSAEIIFICVGTPTKENGIDLGQVYAVFDELAPLIKESASRKIIVIRSTVIPGTTLELIQRLEKLTSKKYPHGFGMVANPEFLRQGNAIEDFHKHNKNIIGSENSEDAEKIKKLYEPFGRPSILFPTKAAEMSKYVSNCFTATKISFINEMGLVSKQVGVDINQIAEALELEIGLGNFPLKAGCGFAGGCLEKDVKALCDMTRKCGSEPLILETVLELNDSLPHAIIRILEQRMKNMNNRKIGVLGLSFKKGTDDIRKSRSTPLITELMKRKARVSAYDPKAMEKMRQLLPGVTYHETAQKVIDESDAVVLLTDWNEFSELEYGDKIVIDGRNIIPQHKRSKNYEGVCWP